MFRRFSVGVCVGVGVGSVARGRIGSELFRERGELLFGCFEFELQLRRVDALGLSDEDTPPQELELLHQLSISAPQIVALGRYARELRTRRCKLELHALQQSLELFYAH